MATPIPHNRAITTTAAAAAATGGAIVRMTGRSERVHAGMTTDSRRVAAGNVYVALLGERFDGHAFLRDAAGRGATLVVVGRGRAWSAEGVDVLEVDDTLTAWGDLARAHLRAWRTADPARRVVAITGSAGKTTTKELCAALLGAAGAVHATRGNLNNRVGVPAMVLGLEQAHRFAVLEVGMSLPGEIEALGNVLAPDVAVVVNVGTAHAEGVGGGREAVAREKGDLYRALPPSGVAVVNVDDDLVVRESRHVAVRADRHVGFGRGPGADYHLVSREPLGVRGSRVVVQRPGGEIDIELSIVGEAAAVDLVAALAAAEVAAGRALTSGELRGGLARLPRLDGRATVRALPGGALLIDDSYNANPESMRAAVATLMELARAERRRAVVVLGEMLELGEQAEAAHDVLGEELADAGVALVIGCGGLAARVLDRAAARGVVVRAASDADEAARLALGEVASTDVVLVKGSRGAATDRVVRALGAIPVAPEATT